MVIATVAIAAFTAGLFILQFRQHEHDKVVARANYQLALFDKRMALYSEIDDFLIKFSQDGKPDFKEAMRMRYNADAARFIFQDGPIKFLDEIAERAKLHYFANRKWEPLRERAWNKEELTEEENKKKENYLAQMQEVEDWFHDQLAEFRLVKEFEPYLRLPDSL